MHGCNQEAKTRAYMALVRPQVEYCSPVWSPNQRKNIDMLEKVQKRAARWVSGTTWDSEHHRWSHSYRDLCKSLDWPTLEPRRSLLSCTQLYKIVHQLDCIMFSKYLSYKRKSNLRCHPHSLRLSHSRINCFRFSFFVNTPHIWNSLPLDIIESTYLYLTLDIDLVIMLCM